jgi:hypothetical protein
MKSKVIYIVVTLMLGFFSCEKPLEEEVFDFVGPTNFYKTAADAEAALTAVYSGLQPDEMWNRGVYLIGDMSSDDTFTGEFRGNASRVQIDEFTVDENNAVVADRWNLSYEMINRANGVIDRVPAIAMDQAQKDNIVNQAKFLRALVYFYLVQLYGDVPMKINETEGVSSIGISRTPAETIYNEVIIPDLIAAEALPVTQNLKGRATQGAAKALLARVYLTRQQWALARDKAKEVIAIPGYDLWENYGDAFKVANENGKEDIFSVQFNNLLGEGGSLQNFFAPRGISGIATNGNGVNEPTLDIVKSYEPHDERFTTTYLTNYPLTNGTVRVYDPFKNPYIAKYNEPAPPIGNVNYPIIRFADVLLMYAEAENELSGPTAEAYAAINRVRLRASLGNLQEKPGYVESQENFRTELRHERRVELAFEGHRRFDLVRWGTYIETMRAHASTYYPAWAGNIDDFETLFPIPAREIELNPDITPEQQNVGY